MHIDSLEILRCPYCGGHLELVTSLYHRSIEDEIHEGVLGCHCCVFPVVDGIPVLQLQPAAVTARGHIEAGHPALALRGGSNVDATAVPRVRRAPGEAQDLEPVHQAHGAVVVDQEPLGKIADGQRSSVPLHGQ